MRLRYDVALTNRLKLLVCLKNTNYPQWYGLTTALIHLIEFFRTKNGSSSFFLNVALLNTLHTLILEIVGMDSNGTERTWL